MGSELAMASCTLQLPLTHSCNRPHVPWLAHKTSRSRVLAQALDSLQITNKTVNNDDISNGQNTSSLGDGFNSRVSDIRTVSSSRTKWLLEKSPVSVQQLDGALSRFLRPEPRRREKSLVSPQERQAAVDSVVAADSLLSALDRVRFKLSHADFYAILRRFGELRKWQQASLVFDWMKVNKKLTAPSVTGFISMMGKAALPEKALRAYKGLTDSEIRQNKFVCNALFRILIEFGHVDKAFVLFDEIKVDGFTPDLYTFSTLIAGCAKHQIAFSRAEGLMEEISLRGLKPDSLVYESLLQMCASLALEDEAESYFEKMKIDNISPNILHYSSLLDIYAEKGKPDEAETVLQKLKEEGLPSTQSICNSLIKAYSYGGQVEKARSLFNEMQSLGFPPDTVSYGLMVYMYCKAGKVDEAHLLSKEMKEKGVIQGSLGYCTLISAYSKLGKVDKVEDLRKELESREGGVLDLAIFNTLLKSYCELGTMEAVIKTLRRMEEECVAPDLATFSILIRYFCEANLLDLAVSTLNDLKAREICPNVDIYDPLIGGLAGSGKVAQAVYLFAEMKEAEIVPSSVVFDSLIVALCKEGRAGEAVAYLKEMLGQGYQNETVKILKYMIEHGYVTHTEGLNQSMQSLEAAGETAAATRLLNQILEMSLRMSSVASGL